VLSQIYDAHAAPAEQPLDAVLTQELTKSRVGGEPLRESCHRANVTPTPVGGQPPMCPMGALRPTRRTNALK
jgi:hypothetical protein